MKLRTIIGVITLLLVSVSALAFESGQVETIASFATEQVREHAYWAFAAPLLFSSNITPQLIKDMQIKYGRIKVITVVAEAAELDKEGKVITPAEQYQFLVKRPDRSLIKMLLPLAEQGKIDEFSDKAVKNLVIKGDMDALEDGIVFMGVVSQLKSMIAPAQAFLSNA